MSSCSLFLHLHNHTPMLSNTSSNAVPVQAYFPERANFGYEHLLQVTIKSPIPVRPANVNGIPAHLSS